jgi:hypothetical protein
MSAVPGVEFVVVDIDADNIDWCRRNLPGHYLQVPLRPPVDTEAESFDVIYGISVLAHLQEPDHRAWLAELQRLAAPGAVVLLTFRGTTAKNYVGFTLGQLEACLARVERKGFVVTSANDRIRDFIDEKGYYVNVAHSTDCERRVWGEYFEVVDILPGMVATHDLAVLRKRWAHARRATLLHPMSVAIHGDRGRTAHHVPKRVSSKVCAGGSNATLARLAIIHRRNS